MSPDMPKPGEQLFPSGRMDRLVLRSARAAMSSNYMVGRMAGGVLHLSRFSGMLQMRPSHDHIDLTDDIARRAEESSNAEAGKGVALKLRFARKETDRAKVARKKSFGHMLEKSHAEPWVDLELRRPPGGLQFGEMGESLPIPFDETTRGWLGAMQLGEASVDFSGDDAAALELAQLRKLAWESRVVALMRKAQVLRHSDVEAYCPEAKDANQLVAELRKCSRLVTGLWVVKSAVLRPVTSVTARPPTLRGMMTKLVFLPASAPMSTACPSAVV